MKNTFLKSLLTFFVFTLFLMTSSAQSRYTTQNKKAINYFEEGLQSANAKNYDLAKQNFEKAIAADNNFIEAHLAYGYLLGDLKKTPEAIKEIKIALGINPTLIPTAFFTLARFEMEIEKYEDAKKHLEMFVATSPKDPDMLNNARQYLTNCDFAINAMKHPVKFNPVNAGPGLNSKYDEYFPCMTADEQLFLFTRKLPTQSNPYGYQEDFYISNKANGKWETAHSIGPKINTDHNEGAPSLSADGKYLFFVVSDEGTDSQGRPDYGLGRKGYGSCDIFISVREGDDWSKPWNVGPGVNTVNWETQPSFSSDGKTLYFIRGIIRQHAIQNADIYMSQIDEGGKFSKAVKLSDKINTPGNEESVFIHPGNQTLYFSSDGHPGMGGMDIFMSRRQPNGEWGEVINLGYPINTVNDENSLLVARDGRIAYFASDRPGGYGGLDIYSFELDSTIRPGVTIYVKGKVYDAVTKQPLDASVEVVDLESGNTVVNWTSNKNTGEFFICLPVNKNYAFNTSKPGYLFRSENFALNQKKDYEPFALSIPLSPITKDSTVILRNVFFETAKYNLKGESKIELDKLVDFLNNNPTLKKIELSGHTDNVGDKKLNQILSENRAKAVYEYLLQHKISKERLTYKGYGDSKPVVPNDSDEHRQMNRRTEFKILAK